jgi:predicted PurR-regulated permease PerM
MMGILFSGWAVLFAVPLAAVLVTLFDVVLRDVDPAEEDTPTVLFTRESEA